MISKSLSTSRKYGQLYGHALGEFCQALYPLLVAHADDFGRLEGDPYTIKHAVVPASPRTVEDVDESLTLLESVGLIHRSPEVVQIADFDRHQTGLHKRTESRLPDVSRNFPEKPTRTEGKGTELNRTEGKGTEGKVNSDGTSLSTRSKRPIFQGQRFVVFDWMLDDLCRMLGPHADNFDLHEWFFTLDANTTQVVPQRDGGKWLQDQTLAEAQRRGLQLAKTPQQQLTKRSAQIIEAVQTIKREEAARRAN